MGSEAFWCLGLRFRFYPCCLLQHPRRLVRRHQRVVTRSTRALFSERILDQAVRLCSNSRYNSRGTVVVSGVADAADVDERHALDITAVAAVGFDTLEEVVVTDGRAGDDVANQS